MYIASQKGHTNIIQLLLDAGADIEAMHQIGATPLYIASEKGHVSTVQHLLSKGAQVNHKTKEGYVNFQSKHVFCALFDSHLHFCQCLQKFKKSNTGCKWMCGSVVIIALHKAHSIGLVNRDAITDQLLVCKVAQVNFKIKHCLHTY